MNFKDIQKFSEKIPEFLEALGTPKAPVRASSLPELLDCPTRWFWNSLVAFSTSGARISSEAADTGSLVHKLIDLYHKNEDPQTEKIRGFSKADRKLASRLFEAYKTKNSPSDVIHSEMRIELTRRGLLFRGTLDQIRGTKIVDLKTSKGLGKILTHRYMAQQSAYLIGAREAGFDVYGAAIYRLRALVARKHTRELWEMPLNPEIAESLLDQAAFQIRLIKEKKMLFNNPGDICSYYCPLGGPGNCHELRKNFFQKNA